MKPTSDKIKAGPLDEMLLDMYPVINVSGDVGLCWTMLNALVDTEDLPLHIRQHVNQFGDLLPEAIRLLPPAWQEFIRMRLAAAVGFNAGRFNIRAEWPWLTLDCEFCYNPRDKFLHNVMARTARNAGCQLEELESPDPKNEHRVCFSHRVFVGERDWGNEVRPEIAAVKEQLTKATQELWDNYGIEVRQ